MTISFCHYWETMLGLSLVWQREESLGGVRRKSIRLRQSGVIWPSNCDKLVDGSFVSNAFHRFSSKWRIWNWVNCTTVKLWQEWFSAIKQRFSFSFDPIDEETCPMFDLLLESNVRHENEEKFFYSKKKRFVYKTKYFDNETKFVFRQRTSRIDVWWTRQWKYDKARFHWQGKND